MRVFRSTLMVISYVGSCWFVFPNVLRFPICRKLRRPSRGQRREAAKTCCRKWKNWRKPLQHPVDSVDQWSLGSQWDAQLIWQNDLELWCFFFQPQIWGWQNVGDMTFRNQPVTFLHPYEWDLFLWYSAQNKATQQRFHEKPLRTTYLQAPALVVNPIRQPYRISSAPPYLNLPYYTDTPMKYHHFPQALLFVILNLNRYCVHRKKKSFIQKSKALLQRSFCFYFSHGFHRFIPFYSIYSPNMTRFPVQIPCCPYFPQL